MNGPARILAIASASLSLAIASSPAQPVASQPTGRSFHLTDKTLVAWVYLDGTAQRAGSALTLIDAQERFDALVFAEVHPQRWMAGSDFFRRTPRDQSAWPAETARPDELIQIAAVYRGSEVTLYRNGRPYAAYRIQGPQSFDDDAWVLLGLRYVGAGGEIGFLKGCLEEARIYDRALDAKAIAALKPNAPSDPAPLGQWTFEDGSLGDSMRNFPPGELRGRARIADGQLHLDGQTAYAVIRPPPRPQSMFFQGRGLGGQWDTWLYYHEGTYYLFILAGPGGKWNGISMARSRNGATWEDLGIVLRRAEGVKWLGTGSTWKSPRHDKDGKYFLNFSEWRGDRQTIFFAESSDLLHWKRLGNGFEFKQDDRWYKPKGRWDCIYTIPHPGGGLYGYWTADPKSGPGVGFGQSLDGVRWEALAPPAFVDGAPHGECGAVEKIGDKYYMMLGTRGAMVTLWADRPEGPFRPARKNFRLLAGQTYFSRFFPTPRALLVNHHSISREGVLFAPLKQAVVDGEGTLRLKWWAGNEALKRHPLRAALDAPPATQGQTPPVRMFADGFDLSHGLVLEGTVELPAAGDAQPPGLFIQTAPDAGMAIRVLANAVTEIGKVKGDGSAFAATDRVDRQFSLTGRARFRLLLKRSLLEFYIDDHLMQCWSLPQGPTGRIGLLGGLSTGAGEVAAWAAEPPR